MTGRTHRTSRATGRTSRSATRLLVLAVAMLAAGCGVVGGAEQAAQTPAAQAAASQALPAATTTATSATPAPVPGPVVAASEQGDLPGITLAVNQLRRSDSTTVTLIFTVANKGTTPYTFDWTWGEAGIVKVGDVFTFDMSGVYLVEPEGKKKYLVLRDTDKHCICSTGIFRSGAAITGLTPGKEATMFAKFPAPPASVAKMAVAVPHFPVLDGVPLAS
jgi:hypothetical protein